MENNIFEEIDLSIFCLKIVKYPFKINIFFFKSNIEINNNQV